MMKKLGAVVLLVAVLVLAAPAAASPPANVNLEVIAETSPGGTFGTFTATGPVADSGVICRTGDILDLDSRVSGWQRGNGINVHARRQFTCDDGSGTFIMNLRAHIQFQPREVSGSWNILSGTGSYEKLHGSGELTDSIILGFDPLIALDLFSGSMHSD